MRETSDLIFRMHGNTHTHKLGDILQLEILYWVTLLARWNRMLFMFPDNWFRGGNIITGSIKAYQIPGAVSICFSKKNALGTVVVIGKNHLIRFMIKFFNSLDKSIFCLCQMEELSEKVVKTFPLISWSFMTWTSKAMQCCFRFRQEFYNILFAVSHNPHLSPR